MGRPQEPILWRSDCWVTCGILLRPICRVFTRRLHTDPQSAQLGITRPHKAGLTSCAGRRQSSNHLTTLSLPAVIRDPGSQGNRTSDLGEELCEIGVLPTGPFDFDTQGALGGFL